MFALTHIFKVCFVCHRYLFRVILLTILDSASYDLRHYVICPIFRTQQYHVSWFWELHFQFFHYNNCNFFKLGFTPCKAEQQLKGTEL